METAQWMNPAWWQSSHAQAPGAELPHGVSLPGWVWFRSSGSTGHPKWLGLTREALLISAAMVNRHLGVGTRDVWGLALPLCHVGGFGVVARAFESGAKLAVFPGKWKPHTLRRWLGEERVNHLSLVPTQVHDLVSARLRPPACLRTLVVGGGRLAPIVGAHAQKLGWPVLASYGMTEAGSQIATQSPGDKYHADRLPVLSHWEMTTDDSDRIFLRGPALFTGRLIRTTSGAWRVENREHDWYPTADRGRLENRLLTVLSRVDRIVKILGELVDLDALETEFDGRAFIIAMPDSRRGQRLILATCDPEMEERMAHHNQRVPGPWRVQNLLRLETMPLTAIGKPDRQALTRLASAIEF